MIQTQENSQKPNFVPNLGLVGPILPPNYFFKNRAH